MIWPVYDAKARFSELLDAAMNEGPQVVSRRGVEAAVVVPIAEWNRLKASARPSLKDILLDANGPHFEDIVQPRGQSGERPVIEFE
ncbi:type II toxin-antitoxin system Phd/YefM family antitoxin [Acidicapsa ligni]|uniref:type II toxin-antitoxin system Phd/YefM family antitoxin n=1 Tax=Acidicapsa ligni TaxID=542300 RepID=UPI0021DFCF6C|nr:type II toxin-antitoxin system Phd/YefM family antitoxin [Acidicapsa ligni]